MIDAGGDPGDDSPASGWEFVAEREGAARLFGTLPDLDPDATYTQTDLADRAGVPLKTLYLNDLAADLVALGVLATANCARTDGPDDASPAETTYRVVPDSELLAVAEAFDEAYRRGSAGD